tara:strand:- start:909 stop:1505 length:597 start_codon:yes stop_codon:yes gene_type:complete
MPPKLLLINEEEKQWVQKLPRGRGQTYHLSRGYIRYALSCLSGFAPLQIPLKADPGKQPLLAKGWGNVSISHCDDALLIGWSSNKIGVDIERIDRKVAADKLSKRFFCKEENLELKNINNSEKQYQVIKRWVIKEAAIKWQGGTIASNIREWVWGGNSSFVYNKKLDYKLNIYNSNFKNWTFAIAFEGRPLTPIVCIN